MDQDRWNFSSKVEFGDDAAAWVEFSDGPGTRSRKPSNALRTTAPSSSFSKIVVDVDTDVEIPSGDCDALPMSVSADPTETSASSFQESCWTNSVSPTLQASNLTNKEQRGQDPDEDHEIERGPSASFPNEPHPMLECPLLYHTLRSCFPGLLESSKLIYAFRWRVSYPLQHRIPFQFGVQATLGELLLLLPFFLYCVWLLFAFATFDTNVITTTGRLTRIGLITTLVLAQRSHSVVTLVLGLPLHRAQKYHRLAGTVAGLAGVLHTIAILRDPVVQFEYHGRLWRNVWFAGWMHASGTVAMCCLVGLVLSSLPLVRRWCFEAFFYLHHVLLVGLLVSAWFHAGPVLPLVACGTWGLDRLCREIQRWWLNPRRASLRTIGKSVVEVRLPKTKEFCYNPGQFVYLTVPAISTWQSHPFSISSAPCQGDVVTLHVRVCGDWTAALYNLAVQQRKHRTVDVRVEGPYGSLSVDLVGDDRKYKKVLLVSGGIGVAPMQSISDQLLFEYSQGQRELRQIQFVWMERDPVVLENAWGGGRSDEDDNAVPHANLAALLLALFPSAPNTDDAEDDDESSSEVPSVMVPRQSNSVILEHPAEAQTPPCHVDVNVYLTSKQQHHSNDPTLPPFACRGRPDWTELFYATRKEALQEQQRSQSKIAVCVSCPRKLQLQLHKACIFFSDERVRFDFHAEQTM